MDSTAFSLCMDNKIPIVVFDMNKPSNIRDVVLGTKNRHAGLRLTIAMPASRDLFTHEQRRHSSRSRNDDGKKRRLHGPRICRGADRQSFAGSGRECGCASLRLGHEIETARSDHHAGTAPAGGATVRCRHRAGYREGAQRIQDRHHAVGRRENYSAADSGAVGRTPQRSGEFAWQDGRGSARARARKPAHRAG